MGIIGSVVVNLAGVTLAAFVERGSSASFPAFVADAFPEIHRPAIFGAVFGQFAMRQAQAGPLRPGDPAHPALLQGTHSGW